EYRERFVRGRALHDRLLDQAARLIAFTALEGRDARLQQFLGLTLLLGKRAARPLDVGARPRVAAIEKQRARPDVDGVVVLAREVMVEAGEQQLLDLGIAFRLRRGMRLARRVGTKRVGHEKVRRL